ncbi:MAG: hypothetical protein ACFFG0_12265 [Candidatus Thorarchaeota archaeon]
MCGNDLFYIHFLIANCGRNNKLPMESKADRDKIHEFYKLWNNEHIELLCCRCNRTVTVWSGLTDRYSFDIINKFKEGYSEIKKKYN